MTPVIEAQRYTIPGAVAAMRRIFDEHRDQSFEARWELAKNSDAYVWFSVASRKCMQFLIRASLPIWVLLVVAHYENFADYVLFAGSHDVLDSVIVIGMIAYLVGIFVVGWRFGTSTATKQLTQSKSLGC